MGLLLSELVGPLTFVLAFTVVVALLLLHVVILGLPFAIHVVVVFPALAELVIDELLFGLRIV